MGATIFYDNAAELATLTNAFAVAAAPTDPTAVSLTITTPAGVATTYTYAAAEITKSGTGIYTKDLACSEAGVWLYLWTGTGTASDAVAGTWTVSSSNLQTIYCTPEELKSRSGITDNYDDAEILGACNAVCRWIDDEYCERHFFRQTQTRTFEACDPYRLNVDDLVSVTTLKTDTAGDGTFATTWSAADYQLLPLNPSAGAVQKPYDAVRVVGSLLLPGASSRAARRDLVQIAGVWGWPQVPFGVKQAAAILAGDYLKLGGMAFGVAGYGDYGAVRARMSSPAMTMLDPYRKHSIKVA